MTMNRRDFLRMGSWGLAGLLAPGLTEAMSVRPTDLVGSPTSLARQTKRFSIDNLSVLYDKDLRENSFYRKSKRLVHVERESQTYYTDGVNFENSVTRPYVSLLLQRFSEQFYGKFGDKMKVTSLTRSFEDQKNLRRRNANATDPLKSPHVRGAGIDISYKNMDSSQKAWMRNTLVSLEALGVVEATEEINQATFHIMVFKNYSEHVRKKLAMSKDNFNRYYERTTGGVLY